MQTWEYIITNPRRSPHLCLTLAGMVWADLNNARALDDDD